MMGLWGLLAATRTDVGGWRWTSLPPAWVLTLVVLLVFFALRALYVSERGRAGLKTRLFLAGLRTLVFFLLLLVLAGPFREEVRTAEERSHLVLLVDRSASMGTSDRYAAAEVTRLREAAWPGGVNAPEGDELDVPRMDLVRRILAPEGDALLRELDRRFVLHAFSFDATWQSLGATRENLPGEATADDADEDPVREIGESIRNVRAEGGGTAIGAVLRNVAREFLGREDRQLAGVLLVTDGRDLGEGESAREAVTGLGEARRDLHVTPVALGNPSTGRNVRVDPIRAFDWVLVEDDVVFETSLRHQGFAGLGNVRAHLTIEKVADEAGRPITPRPYDPVGEAVTTAGPLRLGPEKQDTPLRFQVRMSDTGTFRVYVRAILPPDAARDDAVPEDDVTVHEIRVAAQRIKVLLVDNLPRRSFWFLSQWLTREPEDDPARPEVRRRYDAYAFQQDADRTIDQRASPGLTPLRSFPQSRRELFAYDVIILGDIDYARLGPTAVESDAILALIRDFVEEGGGLALQAGEEYQNPLGFRETPLQDLLPVTVRERDKTASERGKAAFGLQLTDAGRRHPIFGIVPNREGGIATPDELAEIWAGTPGTYGERWKWYWLYRATGGLRPGAVDLARVRALRSEDAREFLDDTARPMVAMATTSFGRGRVFWSAMDSVWRIRRGQGDRFYGPFWDQVIRYLATYRLLGGNKRFKIETDKEKYFERETAAVTFTALDRDYEPMADPFLDGVHVQGPDGEDVLLEGDKRPVNTSTEGDAPGTYRTYLPLRRTGTWRIWIRDADAGLDRGLGSRAEQRFEVEFRAPELRQTIPDHDLLTFLAEETSGRLVEGRPARLYDLPQLARELPSRTAVRVLDRHQATLWDSAWVLLLIVALLGLEWYLRKRWQMI